MRSCASLREAGYALPLIPLLVGGQAMIWLTWPFGTAGLLGAYGGTIVVCMVWRLVGQGLREQPVNYLRDISAAVLLATWVPLFASFSALLIFQDHGGSRTFTVIVTVVFADIGGYVAGVLFGKHLMAPAISPKKSWEGFGGSLLFGVTAAVLSVTFLLDKPAWVGVPLGLMLVITGVLGDLVESQVKRDLGIKDMGTLLPGHGGIMDRIDAMLPSAVAGWIVLTAGLASPRERQVDTDLCIPAPGFRSSATCDCRRATSPISTRTRAPPPSRSLGCPHFAVSSWPTSTTAG